MEVKIIHNEYVEPKMYDEQGNEIEQEGKEEYKAPYQITYEDNRLLITVSTKFKSKDVELSIPINLQEQDSKLLELMIKENIESVNLTCYEIFKYVDVVTGTRNIKLDGSKIARVLIDKEQDICYVMLFLKTKDIDGFENILQDKNLSSTGMLQSVCPWFKQRCADIERKRALINNIDIYKSIAYLEAQVDLLTRLAIQYAPKSELISLLEIADKYSVLNNKPSEDVKSEFEVNKADFRKKQERYYERVQETK